MSSGDPVLSAGVRQNLLSLQNTAAMMAKTQNRLATGRKVNTALDNPTNFFTSQALSFRASDLNSLLDAIGQGQKVLEAADQGITAMTKTVESMQATVRQARQDKSWQSATYTVDTDPAGAIGIAAPKQIAISGGSVTGTVNIALNAVGNNGTQGSIPTQAAYAAPTTAQPARYTAQNVYAAPGAAQALNITFTGADGVPKSVAVNIDATETSLQEAIDKVNAAILLDADTNGVIQAEDDGTGRLRITTVGNLDGAITVTGAGEPTIFGAETTQAGSDGQWEFTVGDGTTSHTVTLTTGDSPSLITAINTANLQLTAAGSNFEAYDAGGGMLGFRERVASGRNVTIGGTDATTLFGGTLTSTNAVSATNGTVNTVDQLVDLINNNVNLTGKVKASNDSGRLRIENLSTTALTIVGATSTALDGSLSTRTIGGNEARKNLVTQFNLLRDQIDKLASDASYNGVNLLRGDKLKLTFNETGTSAVEIQAVDSNDNPTSINATKLLIDVATGIEFDNDTTLDLRLDQLVNALTTLRSHASKFGSNQTIVETRLEFTNQLITVLQTGADQLVLADTNEEGANMLALQTRQQLSTTALSLSSQADQAVLRLFG
jgi:flagellin-like hook-associated protein FlgL